MSSNQEEVPRTFSLSQSYPNPFNPSCEIRYGLPKDARVKLVIYNMLGQRVRTLVDEHQGAGFNTVTWYGRDDYGRAVTSGVYVYRIHAGEFSETRKMVLLK
jgi:hypothetical protein